MHPGPRLTFSLRHLLIMLTAIGLLPLALLGVWSIHAAGEYQQREQERLMLDLARALSSAADAELDGAVAMLTNLGRTPALQEGDLRAFYNTASALAKTQPEWLGVILTDDSGKILFRTMDAYGAPAAQVVDPDSLQQVLATRQPVVGHIARGFGGRAAFPVRVPAIDADGELYTLTAVIRPDRMVRVIERQRVPRGAVISIRDSNRLAVARSTDHRGTVGTPPSPSMQALMRSAGPEGIGLTRTIEGEDVTTAYTSRSRYGWSVAVGRPTVQLRAPALERLGVYGAGIALSLLVCIVLATLLSNRLVAKIRGLQHGAVALGSGAPLTLSPSSITEIELTRQALQQAERRRSAQELERKKLLDSLNLALTEAHEAGRAKDEFLAVLGHELRNPLSPIVTSLDLLDRRDDPASQKERAIMRRQVNHLRRLVDDLLDVSRITSGKLQIDAHPVNLSELVRHAAAATGQPVAVSVPDAVWVVGDDSRLTQVLNNLLSNAARFGSTATKIELGSDGVHARLLVSDNGIGMSGELLACVFEPFQQAPQSLARHTGGLGLGLAIVRKIVELHGGTVHARSGGADAGSQFEVVLPMCEPPCAQTTAAAAAGGNGLRVLLVDDNADAAIAGAALLEALGHTVQVAHNAAEALAAVRRRLPEVAILDIGLPDMDGYALASAIRQLADGAPLRLVALTGYGQKEDIERALNSGFDLHLTKPATLADLQRATMHAESAHG